MPPAAASVEFLAKLINEHPFPSIPLRPLLLHHLLPLLNSPSYPLFLYSLFHHLLTYHSLPHKSLEIFRFNLLHSPSSLSPSSLSILLTSLSRSPLHLLFPSSAFHLLDISRRAIPSLLSPPVLSSLLSPLPRLSPHNTFSSTLSAFHRSEHLWLSARRPPFSSRELNSLLRAFCSRGRIADARAAFRLLHSRLPPDSRSFNTLLLGFRNAGHLPSLDLFYHDLLRRRFRPDAVTFNIRIDAYCKQRRFFHALRLLDSMEERGLAPTVRIITTLIHGAGIAGEFLVARKLFDEMPSRGIVPDRAAYNALASAVVRAGDVEGGVALLDEMELKGVGVDDVSYYTMLCGYGTWKEDFDGVLRIYRRMMDRGLVPRTRTVMLLMKLFRGKGRLDLGLELWNYLVGKGCCPHRRVLDLLAKELCFGGGVAEVYECFKQVVERGRLPSQRGIQLLEEFLVKAQDEEKLEGLREMIYRLKTFIPNSS